MNSIVQVKTVPVNGPKGPTHAIMMAINIDDDGTAEAFVAEVAEQFKLYRTAAPPDTSMLLITLIGPLTAQCFASRWRDVERTDGVIRAYMSLMIRAEAVQGDETGNKLSATSLLADQPL